MTLMTSKLVRRWLPAFVLAASGSFAADKAAVPEPKILATVQAAAKTAGACIVHVEVRNPDTNAVLAAPSFAVVGGKETKSPVSMNSTP
jgi:hypothetical protein